MNVKRWILAGLLFSALPALAKEPPSLAQSNPLGHRTLSDPDYLHFVPCPEPLSGNFVPAYSGTSELFLKGVFAQLARIHPGAAWGKEFQWDSSAGVIAMLLRAFGTGRFLTLWLLIAAAVPVAVLVRIAMNAARGVAGTGPAVADVVVGFGLGLGASLVGMLVGSLFLLRSSRRPK